MSTPPPPPPPSAVPSPGEKVKLRGRIPLRLAAIFGVIGLALCIVGVVIIVNSPLNKTDDFPRVDVGGAQTVDLDRTGDYVLYFVTPSRGSHTAHVRVSLQGPDGDVRLSRYANTLTYDLDGKRGEALFTFSIRQSGEYRVNASSDDAPQGSQLAFGESVANGIVGGVLTFIPGLLLVIAAVVLLIVGLVRRSRHKRELASVYRGGYGDGRFGGSPPRTYGPPR